MGFSCIFVNKHHSTRQCHKLKEFADDNFKFDENGKKLSKRVENTVGKGEIARYEQFLLFPQCFQKACFPGVSKGVIVWEWVKRAFIKIPWHSIKPHQDNESRVYKACWFRDQDRMILGDSAFVQPVASFIMNEMSVTLQNLSTIYKQYKWSQRTMTEGQGHDKIRSLCGRFVYIRSSQLTGKGYIFSGTLFTSH